MKIKKEEVNQFILFFKQQRSLVTLGYRVKDVYSRYIWHTNLIKTI